MKMKLTQLRITDKVISLKSSIIFILGDGIRHPIQTQKEVIGPEKEGFYYFHFLIDIMY